MGATTAISWCDHTFNGWIGCTKVSTGALGACEGCYAEVSTPSRVHGVLWGNHPRHRTAPSTWAQPRAWSRKAEVTGARPFVFCSSLADVFDNQVPPEWRRDLFDLIRRTPSLVWLLLTKRPQNIVKLFRETVVTPADTPEAHRLDLSLWWPRNAAIGCTVVTQAEADRDIPVLLAAKAALNPAFAFVSMEPLLGPVSLTVIQSPTWARTQEWDALRGRGNPSLGWSDAHRLDWVITGGETDQGAHKARPSHPDWFRSLRDQCAAAGVVYHHKQNGEWAPTESTAGHIREMGSFDGSEWRPETFDPAWQTMAKVGKKAAGRALDGVIHDARPVL